VGCLRGDLCLTVERVRPEQMRSVRELIPLCCFYEVRGVPSERVSRLAATLSLSFGSREMFVAVSGLYHPSMPTMTSPGGSNTPSVRIVQPQVPPTRQQHRSDRRGTDKAYLAVVYVGPWATLTRSDFGIKQQRAKDRPCLKLRANILRSPSLSTERHHLILTQAQSPKRASPHDATTPMLE